MCALVTVWSNTSGIVGQRGISARKIVRAGLGVGRVRHGFPEMTCAVGCKVKMNGFTEVILYGGFYSEVGGGEELRQWTSVFIQ